MSRPPRGGPPHDSGFDASDAFDLMLTSASSVPAALGSDVQQLATDGIEALRTWGAPFVSAVITDKGEIAEKVGELLQDEVVCRQLGAALVQHEGLVDAVLAPLRPVLRRDNMRVIERRMKHEASVIRADEAERIADVKGQAITRLLQRGKVPDAPTNLRMPPGYSVDEEGVTDSDGHLLTHRPLVILGYAEHAITGDVSLRMAWSTPSHRWVVRNVARHRALDGRSLTALARQGAPIHGGAAGAVARYLAAFEAANGARLGCHRIAHQVGWIDSDTFLLPDECITTDPNAVPTRYVAGQDPETVGAAGYIAGIRKGGSLEGWRDMFRSAPELVQVACLAAACTPLLRLVAAEGLEGFVLDISGSSSFGKSVALHTATTVWGPPKGTLFQTWKVSRVGAIGIAAAMSGIPLVLDDTKHAKARPQKIVDLVYEIPVGREGAKAQVTGDLRAGRTWSSSLLSTGEHPLADFSTDQGVHGRVLNFDGSPFRSKDAAAAWANGPMLGHYGWAGPAVVRWAMAPQRRPQLALMWSRCTELLMARVDPGDETPYTRRLMQKVALLHLAARALGLEADAEAALELAAFAAQGGEDGHTDVHRESFEAVRTWATAHIADFYDGGVGQPYKEPMQPHGGWKGVCDPDWIGVLPQLVSERLRRAGHTPKEHLRRWRDLGLIETSPGCLTVGKRPLPGDVRGKVRYIVLRRDV